MFFVLKFSANIKKKQFFVKRKRVKVHFYVIKMFGDFLDFRLLDLIITLPYVLMDNFCPYFLCIALHIIAVDTEFSDIVLKLNQI